VNESSYTVVVIYRPGSEAIQSVFFDELDDLLDCVATFAEPVYIVGDFNVRLDRADVVHASRLMDLLNSYGLDLPMNGLTLRLGGLLDVVTTSSDLPPPTVKIMDVELSDHHLLQWTVPTARIFLSPTSIVERRLWKSLDIGKFRSEISLSALCQPDVWQGLDVEDLAELYKTA